MLKVYQQSLLTNKDLDRLTIRNADENKEISNIVHHILERVKAEGDQALFFYTKEFDQVALKQLYIGADEINRLSEQVNKQDRCAIDVAYANIHTFHSNQLTSEEKVETFPGVCCWRESRPIESVGLYVPGGSAVLPSTLLMLGIPARIAGCKNIVVCTPPQINGSVNKYIAYCAQKLHIDRLYLVGGAQAIGAMAYGTNSIPRVNKIFGPGNQFVTQAKLQIQSHSQTAIDMPAGPSEVLIIADQTANPAYIAADLLSQAEHGADSRCILVTTSRTVVDHTINELKKQIILLPRVSIAEQAIKNSFALIVDSLDDAIDFSNLYAPEHLILAWDTWSHLIPKINNAGSVFAGRFTPEAAGDYASGTNHTLPTAGFAKSYSGVSVDSFIKKITFQHIDKKGIYSLGPSIETLAELEGLRAHAHAVKIRYTDF